MSQATFGYRWVKDPDGKAEQVEHSDEQATIDYIFDMRAKEYSWNQICALLAEGDHKNKSGNATWVVSQVHRIYHDNLEVEEVE